MYSHFKLGKTGIFVDFRSMPKYDRCRPDFMSPSPRVVVSQAGSLDLEDDDFDEDPAFEDIDVEKRAIRYYESQKVLGKLYRAIDEQRFLARMNQDRQYVTGGSPNDMLAKLLTYMQRMAGQYLILFTHHLDFAREIRAG